MPHRIKTIILGIFLVLVTSLCNIPHSWASTLGVSKDHLASCPSSPNCVVSQDGDLKHSIDPITYHIDQNAARETLLKVLAVVPRTEIVEQTDSYIHALSKSRIFGFVDDVEFYFPKDQAVIHIRSASRIGDSDLGVNRRRLEQIRLALNDLKV